MKSAIEIIQPLVRQKAREIINKKHIDLGHASYEIYLVDSDVEQMVLKGGTHVSLYISGLNISGGTLTLTSPEFWRDVTRLLKRIKEVWEPCLLIDRNLMRVYQNGIRNKLKEKVDFAELVDLIPLDEMDVHTMSNSTFTDKETGEEVSFHYNDENYASIFNDARNILSQRRAARNLIVIEEAMKEDVVDPK